MYGGKVWKGGLNLDMVRLQAWTDLHGKRSADTKYSLRRSSRVIKDALRQEALYMAFDYSRYLNDCLSK